jgi:hypothetical protein
MLGIMFGIMDCLTQSRLTVLRVSLHSLLLLRTQIQLTRGLLNYENLNRNAIDTFIAPRALDMPNPYLKPASFAPRLRPNRHHGIGPERA